MCLGLPEICDVNIGSQAKKGWESLISVRSWLDQHLELLLFLSLILAQTFSIGQKKKTKTKHMFKMWLLHKCQKNPVLSLYWTVACDSNVL